MKKVKEALQEFYRLTDPYYWLTAYIIAQNAITRQYKNSFLGMLWTVLLPLLQVIIYSIIMPLIMRFPVQNYILYLIASYPLWVFFSLTLVTSAQSITNQAEALKRCVVSSTIFPVADVLKNFYTYLVSFLTMYGFCIIFLTPFNPIVLLLPLYLLPLVIIVMAMSVAIAFIAPYVRDIADLVVVGMSIMFWLTPVVYPLKVLPEHLQGWFWLNPFFVMMRPVHDLVYEGHIPTFSTTMALLVLTLVVVVVSYSIYRLCRRNYVYYL